MAITAGQIKAAFAEFTSLSSSVIDLWIAQADRRICADAWGAKADDGRLFLTAHLLTLAQAGNSLDAGPVSSERVLSTAATYAVGSVFSDDALGSTSYGRYYIGLRRTVFAPRVLE